VRTIWKFPLYGAVNDIEMPGEALVLCAHEQDGESYLWVQVDPDNTAEFRRFEVVGTGNPVPSKYKGYIGTTFIDRYVWHVYEI
jgi:hypothetical protein